MGVMGKTAFERRGKETSFLVSTVHVNRVHKGLLEKTKFV
jgi:hypothetical protein